LTLGISRNAAGMDALSGYREKSMTVPLATLPFIRNVGPKMTFVRFVS